MGRDEHVGHGRAEYTDTRRRAGAPASISRPPSEPGSGRPSAPDTPARRPRRPAELPAAQPDERDEHAGPSDISVHSAPRPFDDRQVLVLARPDGDHQPSAVGELLAQRIGIAGAAAVTMIPSHGAPSGVAEAAVGLRT